MSKIATFVSVLKRTFTQPSYYADILQAPFSFSLKFFFAYFFFYALIGTGIFALQRLDSIKRTLTILPAQLESLYPDGLEIRIKDGTLSTNAEEPFFVRLSDIEKAFKEDNVLGARANPIANALVIDTTAAIEDFERYQTAVLLTRANLVAAKDNGGYEVYPLRDSPDMTINKQLAMQTITTIKPFLKWVIPSLIALVFFGIFLLLPSVITTMLLWYAFAIWLVAKTLSFQLSYKKSYQMGLHLVLFPLTFTSLFRLANINIAMPFFNTIVIALLSGIILKQLKKEVVKTTS